MNPYDILSKLTVKSNYYKMIGDASRFIPDISKAIYKESIYEVKTILLRNEINDGRPILFEKSMELKGLYSVLGGKIDNIYDILEKLELEDLSA